MAFLGRLFSSTSPSRPPEKYAPPDAPEPTPSLVPKSAPSSSPPLSVSPTPAPLFSGMVVRAAPAAVPPSPTHEAAPASSSAKSFILPAPATEPATATPPKSGFSFLREPTEDAVSAAPDEASSAATGRAPRRKVVAKKRTPALAKGDSTTSVTTPALPGFSDVSSAPMTADPTPISPRSVSPVLPSMDAVPSGLPQAQLPAAPSTVSAPAPSPALSIVKSVVKTEDLDGQVAALTADCAKAVHLCQAMAAELDSTAEGLLRTKTSLTQGLISLAEKQSKLEREQAAVLAALDQGVSEADLAHAERLAAELEVVAKDVEALQAKDATLTSEYRAAAKRATEAREAEARFQRELATALVAVARRVEAAAEKRREEAKAGEAAEMTRLQDEEERLLRTAARLNLDEKMLADDEHEAEAAIASKTQPFELEKQMWAAKRASVRREIEALQAQLRAKEAEESGYVAKVTNLQEDIDRITTKYRKTLVKTAAARATLRAESERLAAEQRLLDAARAQAREAAQKQASEIATRKAVVNDVHAKARAAEEAASAAEAKSKRGQLRSDAVTLIETESAGTRARREHLEAVRAAARSAALRLQNAEAESGAKKAAAAKLTTSLPELEATKKSAVAARNFKEAARLTADLKTAQTQLQELEAAQDALRAALDAARASAQAAEQEALQAEEDLRGAQRSEAAEKLSAMSARMEQFDATSPERLLLHAAARLIAQRCGLPLPSEQVSKPSEVAVSTGDAPSPPSLPSTPSAFGLDLDTAPAVEPIVESPPEEPVHLEEADHAAEVAALEAAIAEAIEKEDFDSAAQLQERCDALRRK